MSLPMVTTQLDSVDANAGNQTNFNESVTVGGSTSSIFGGPGTGPPPLGPNPTDPNASTASTAPNWGLYLLLAAMFYLTIRWGTS